jgi:hypothetical protein
MSKISVWTQFLPGMFLHLSISLYATTLWNLKGAMHNKGPCVR